MDFANKYRVNTFKEICGNDNVKSLLKNLVATRKFPKFLGLYGEPGTCKSTLSYLLIKAYKCTSPIDGEPCNTCENCKAINESLYETGEPVRGLNIFNFSMAEEEEQDNRINAVIALLKSKNMMGTERFIIINELHNCTIKKQQNFLTPFEYIPKNTHIIITTTDYFNKIAEGIRSRMTAFQLEKPGESEVVDRLHDIAINEDFKITKEKLHKLARIKNCNMRECLNTLEILKADPSNGWDILTKEYAEDIEQLIEFFKACQGGIIELISFIQGIGNKAVFLKSLPTTLSKALQLKDESDGIVSPDLRKRLNEQTDKMSIMGIVRIIGNLLGMDYITEDKASAYLLVVGCNINKDIYRSVDLADAQNGVSITRKITDSSKIVVDIKQDLKPETTHQEGVSEKVVMTQIQNAKGEFSLNEIFEMDQLQELNLGGREKLPLPSPKPTPSPEQLSEPSFHVEDFDKQSADTIEQMLAYEEEEEVEGDDEE